MNALTRQPKQLTLAVAALAIVAVVAVAVALAAGGTQVRAQDGLDITPNPEPCSDNPARVVSSGHYAIFDVYWDADDKNLVTNPCPPEIDVEAHTKTTLGTTTTTYTYKRTASDIDIDTTIFHIPGDPVEVRANNLEDYWKWTFLYPDADPGEDGVMQASEVGDPTVSEVWSLPACHHDADDAHADAGLCIGFSAVSLNAADWEDLDFEFESIREPGFSPNDRGDVYVYAPGDATTQTDAVAIWDTSSPDSNEIALDGGGYAHHPWLFTKPGRYQFSVHVKAHPSEDNSLTEAEGVTSLVRTYDFHVGPLAGLEVDIDADDDGDSQTTPSPAVGATVTYTVTATNHGPDAASKALVQVNLPEGMSYVGNANQTVSQIDGTVAWAIEEMAKPTTDTDGAIIPAVQTLTFDATVDTGAGGLKLTAQAEIRDQEKTDLDDSTADNTDSVSITSAGTAQNRAPMFTVSRQVHEMARAGTPVGEPIRFGDADMDTLTYSLSGLGADAFNVDSTGQITVTSHHDTFEQAAASALDYETKWSYDLRLDVSDANATDSIRVQIALEDVAHDGATLDLTYAPESPTAHEAVTLTAETSGLPRDVSDIGYRYSIKLPDNAAWYSEFGGETHSVGPFGGKTARFIVDMEFRSGGRWHGLTSEEVSITWPGS